MSNLEEVLSQNAPGGALTSGEGESPPFDTSYQGGAQPKTLWYLGEIL